MLSITQQNALNNILNCDPLIGDTACQIRAVYLLSLYKKLREYEPDEQDTSFIEDCLFLTRNIQTTFTD